MLRKTLSLLLSSVVGLACGGTGELKFLLTDAPGDFDSIFVDIVGIDVHVAGDDDRDETAEPDARDDEGRARSTAGGWVRVTTPIQQVDLLTLQNGVTLDLGGTTLEAGDYDKIRLIVSGGSVVAAGQASSLRIPSGAQTGIKFHYDLTIEPDVTTTLTLDFDGAASVHMDGTEYVLNPVLKVKDRTEAGR
jgi:hypothetical protein